MYDYTNVEGMGWTQLVQLGFDGCYPCLELHVHEQGQVVGLWLSADGVTWFDWQFKDRDEGMRWVRCLTPVVGVALESHRLTSEIQVVPHGEREWLTLSELRAEVGDE